MGSVLLAVLFENGNIAVWQFQLPFAGKESISSCNTIESGISSPSVLFWWEYEHNNRKMSGLIVGSAFGPVKILPVNLKAVKGYFTLRQPVVLWKEMDQLPDHSIKCVPLYHPYQKCSCSLVVAARVAVGCSGLGGLKSWDDTELWSRNRAIAGVWNGEQLPPGMHRLWGRSLLSLST